jgi:hypothetical protein
MALEPALHLDFGCPRSFYAACRIRWEGRGFDSVGGMHFARSIIGARACLRVRNAVIRELLGLPCNFMHFALRVGFGPRRVSGGRSFGMRSGELAANATLDHFSNRAALIG